jgi:hypothetical protein
MFNRTGFFAITALAAFWPLASAVAQHHHHHGGHGSGIGIHFGGGGHGHSGIGIHYDDDDHYDHGHYSHGHHSYGHHHHHSGWHDSDWLFVVPHYDSHYHGTYYVDDGISYYVPRTYATNSQRYVAAKPLQLEFGGYAHVDDLAGRLERQVNQLCLELHHNYRHNAGYAATYREAYTILEIAKYIHDKEHQGDRDEVARRLDEVDGLFHHVQDDVARWSRRQARQIGQGGLQTKLQAVEATLHHLMHDVGVEGSHLEPPAGPAEIAPLPAN